MPLVATQFRHASYHAYSSAFLIGYGRSTHSTIGFPASTSLMDGRAASHDERRHAINMGDIWTHATPTPFTFFKATPGLPANTPMQVQHSLPLL